MKVFIFVVILLLFTDIALLNYKAFFGQPENVTTETDYNVVQVASPSAQNVVDSCYPDSCVDLIREATASLVAKPAPTSKPPTTSSVAKEYYIPFGAGQIMSDEWQDVPGLAAYIDSTKYGKIKTVTFEASMHVPTGNGQGYAQLFNATDQHPVWFSEVSMAVGDTSKSQLLVSQPVTLDLGNKLYKVQMKTSLRYLTILDSARVHIITE